MAESKVISVRVPLELLEAIDKLATERYPTRRGEPNRSQVLLDALEAYFRPSVDNVDILYTSSTNTEIESRIVGLVEERLVSIQSKLAALESELGELSA
ncbi:MAG TPA: ribbon-helix-helix domain-containing protein [Leptolyngbyaceae cyanobacterium]